LEIVLFVNSRGLGHGGKSEKQVTGVGASSRSVERKKKGIIKERDARKKRK